MEPLLCPNRLAKIKGAALRRRCREVVEVEGEGAMLRRHIVVMVVARWVGNEGRAKGRAGRGVIMLYVVVA